MRAACTRIGLLAALALSASPAGPPQPAEYVQAVEFPYYLCPHSEWERELVWIKSQGIRTIEFSIPWNWHQLAPGDFDLTGRTNPRRDLLGMVRLVRRLGLHAWIRPLPPVAKWPNNGTPAPSTAAAQRAWLKALESALAPHTVSHGGPIAWVEGGVLAIDAAVPPAPVVTVAAGSPDSLAKSREAFATGHGALIWTGLEDSFYPAGWEPGAGPLLYKGAASAGAEDPPAASILRRDGALLENWSALLAGMQNVPMPKPLAGKLPEGVTAQELTSTAASAVSISNRGADLFHDEVRVLDPISKRTLVIPGVKVEPGESLWLPVMVSLGQQSLCRECSNFSIEERIVYATAELLTIEYENGILAMEFAAPDGGEAMLQLERKPVGPFLAGGKPTDFDWDEKTFRTRLPIPANRRGDHRVRIGIAMEAPETSAFFNDARRLIVGQKNVISTSYSSSTVAERSRLRLPAGYTAIPKPRQEEGIDYEIAVPADAVPGDTVNLALEADGMLSGRAHLQLFRGAEIHVAEAIRLHFGTNTAIEVDPPTVIADPKTGTNLEVVIRNNWPIIQTFRLEASGAGLDFFPARNEISIGAMDERRYSLRIFGTEGAGGGVHEWRLKVSGGAAAEMPMRTVLVPRGRTIVWSADLDGDGSPEWIVEDQKMRAVFSSQDGGRWMELTAKAPGVNFLPEQGAFAAVGPVEMKSLGDRLEIAGRGWRRTVSLNDAVLSIEQNSALPADGLTTTTRGNVSLAVEHPAPTRSVYTLRQ